MSAPSSKPALAQLWSEGLPLSEIGRRLGVSRSAIAGRIARLRVKGSKFPARPAPVVTKPIAHAERPTPVTLPAPAPPPRLLIDLKQGDCLWPVGSAPDGRHLFCGAARAAHAPYCSCHVSRASAPQTWQAAP